MKPHEVISHAAQLIDDRGLARGQFENDRGELCILGACRFLITGDPFKATPEVSAVGVILNEYIFDKFGSGVLRFNDEFAHDKEHVVATLRACAKELRDNDDS